jgi:hypothetical protein
MAPASRCRTHHRRRSSRFGRTPGKYDPPAPEAPLRSYRVARHARRMAAHAAADYALVRTPPSSTSRSPPTNGLRSCVQGRRLPQRDVRVCRLR